jgi:pimeloyl-ACP methyl ester carboxylesterase
MKLRQKFAVAYIRAKFKVLAAVSKKKAAARAFDLFCTPQSKDVNDLPLIFKGAETLRFRFQDYSIVGYRWNRGDGHRKAMVIHGFESSVINFEKYIIGLVKKGYEVLAFDAPAHGHSSGKRINAMLYRDFIKFVCKKYGPVHSFMAHSLGGLALGMALAEVSHKESDRVVLIAPATETKTAVDNFFHFIHLDGEVRKEFENIIRTMSGHTVSWFSIKRAIKKIKASILWLHDKDDKVTPLKDVFPVKEENYPNVQFVITKGLGHRRIYRDAGVIKTIVNFL